MVTGAGDDIERFAELVARRPVPLGSAALAVAGALGRPDAGDEAEERLQALADGVPRRDLSSVVQHLFVTEGLRGDEDSYYDPENSLLPAVLQRRRGIPITLAIVAVDVARRLDVAASVVGMPGHVLIGDGPRPARWYDGFHGGQVLDVDGARARFVAIHGRHAPFDVRYLQATPDELVLARVLANLVGIYASSGDGHLLVRVRLLRAAIAAVGEQERPELADALAAVGRFSEAADVWDAESASRVGDDATAAADRATALRANLN